MVAVYFQDCFFEFLQFLEFVKVKRRPQELIIVLVIVIKLIVIDLNEGVDEGLYFLLRFVGADVCAPNYLGVAGFGLHASILHARGGELGGGTHRQATRLLVVRGCAVGVEGGGAEHAVHIHVAAASLEVRHHVRCRQNSTLG